MASNESTGLSGLYSSPEVFSICSWNYVPKALYLRQSLLRVAPDISFTLFLTETRASAADSPCLRGLRVFFIDDLYSPEEISLLASRYDVLELNTSVKARCFSFLFSQGAEALVYLDPDIEVFSELAELPGLLDRYDAVVTPHIFTPYDDLANPGNLDILASGTLNLGFLALRKAPASGRFLNWWESQLFERCTIDHSLGIFVDQKYGEFIPSFIEKTHVLHHPGYNVAYWNLHERRLSALRPYTVNSEPLRFFHYSGLLRDPSSLSKFQNRFVFDEVNVIYQLAEAYLNQCDFFRSSPYVRRPNDFSLFADGRPVLPIHRCALRLTSESLPLTNQANLVFQPEKFFQTKKINVKLSLQIELEFECEPILAASLKLAPWLLGELPIGYPYPTQLKEWFVSRGFKHFGLREPGIEG